MNRSLVFAFLILVFPFLSASATDSAVGYAHLQSGKYIDAYREFRGLAERGYPIYQNIVAGMHADGKGVPRDLVLAHVWYSLSAAQGDREGRAGKDRLEKELTNDQLMTSRQLAQEYAMEYLAPYRKIGDWQLN
jgi:TPR repeat protein